MSTKRARLSEVSKISSCVDLTSLTGLETNADLLTLCARSASSSCACVCVYPSKVKTCVGSGARVAGVANFPTGDESWVDVREEIRTIVGDGGQEVDVVLPWRWLKERAEAGVGECEEFLRKVRAECTGDVKLKVIIESGELKSPELIKTATKIAIKCGADFVKTSTGKTSISATPEAAKVMLETIRDFVSLETKQVGFKASGGIKTLEDAVVYVDLYENIIGQLASADGFRVGASSLLDDLDCHRGNHVSDASKPTNVTGY